MAYYGRLLHVMPGAVAVLPKFLNPGDLNLPGESATF